MASLSLAKIRLKSKPSEQHLSDQSFFEIVVW